MAGHPGRELAAFTFRGVGSEDLTFAAVLEGPDDDEFTLRCAAPRGAKGDFVEVSVKSDMIQSFEHDKAARSALKGVTGASETAFRLTVGRRRVNAVLQLRNDTS